MGGPRPRARTPLPKSAEQVCWRMWNMATNSTMPAFRQPSPIERLFNRIFGVLVGLGLGPRHNYLLQIRGRKSGKLYSTPINLLENGWQIGSCRASRPHSVGTQCRGRRRGHAEARQFSAELSVAPDSGNGEASLIEGLF